MSVSAPTWCFFRLLPSDSEAASVSACCNYSLSTLEVSHEPGATSFALVEQEHAEIWRWAVHGAAGTMVESGWQPTQLDAKRFATQALLVGLSVA